jgi:hypothetical protein
MKTERRRWGRWLGSGILGTLLLGCVLWGVVPWAETAPFGIKPGAITETNFSLTITNGQSTNYYEIYLYDILQENALSIRTIAGSIGQTNFTIDTEGRPWLFYKAAEDNDWDDDGIPNVFDADPRNAAVGALTITIESPAHGSNLQ